MRAFAPVCFDATHSVQQPGAGDGEPRRPHARRAARARRGRARHRRALRRGPPEPREGAVRRPEPDRLRRARRAAPRGARHRPRGAEGRVDAPPPQRGVPKPPDAGGSPARRGVLDRGVRPPLHDLLGRVGGRLEAGLRPLDDAAPRHPPARLLDVPLARPLSRAPHRLPAPGDRPHHRRHGHGRGRRARRGRCVPHVPQPSRHRLLRRARHADARREPRHRPRPPPRAPPARLQPALRADRRRGRPRRGGDRVDPLAPRGRPPHHRRGLRRSRAPGQEHRGREGARAVRRGEGDPAPASARRGRDRAAARGRPAAREDPRRSRRRARRRAA